MAPSLPSCIRSTFCSHRQASWFLLATLSPFFLPFLILSVPFLLLFLAPVSCFLFSLLLLYKLQVFTRLRHVHVDKAVERYQETQQIAAAERVDVQHQAPLEQEIGGRRYGLFPACEGLEGSDVQSGELHAHHKGDTEMQSMEGGLEGSNVQSVESHAHHKERDTEGSNVQSAESHIRHKGDIEGLCIPPLSAGDFEEEKREDIEEELAVQGGTTEEKIEEKQEEQEGLEEGLRARLPHSPERESNLTEETRGDMGEEDYKQEEKDTTEEGSGVRSGELHAHHKGDTEVQSAESHPHHKGGDREGSNVQSVESQVHHNGDMEGLCIPPLSVRAFEEEKREDIEEELAAQGGTTEEKQEEQEGLEEGLRAHLPHSPERESNVTEETREDMGEELLRNDMMQDNKQEEKDTTEEVIDLKEEQKHVPFCVDARSSGTLTSLPPTYERESLDVPYCQSALTLSPPTYERESLDVPYHQRSVPFEQQGEESLEDRNARLESSHTHPLEKAWRELPAIQSSEPLDFQAQTAFPTQIVEKPREDDTFREQLEIDTPFTEIETQEHIGEEGEPSCSLPEGHGQSRKKAVTKETIGDVQPQEGMPAMLLAESPAEQEEGYPSEATSSAVPPPHVSHGGIEVQDRILEEQKILADINAIKKIVGYESEPHASIMDQINALYMFLGMEPYYWAAEVDDLERAQAEIELLKVVVGVK